MINLLKGFEICKWHDKYWIQINLMFSSWVGILNWGMKIIAILYTKKKGIYTYHNKFHTWDERLPCNNLNDMVQFWRKIVFNIFIFTTHISILLNNDKIIVTNGTLIMESFILIQLHASLIIKLLWIGRDGRI